MTFRLLGLSDEQRLEIEQATGIKTEGVKLLLEASLNQAGQLAEQMIADANREVQEVIGPHGSVTRLQAGGVRISPGMGVSIFEDGVLKTTLKPTGDLVVGSNIEAPETTTLCAFVNDQVYNNEDMGAGDLLIGDNSDGSANVKYDASEGRLEFRGGTTVQVYIDTDGSLAAGGGNVKLTNSGIQILEDPGGTSYILFYDSTGATLKFYLGVTGDNAQFVSPIAGKAVQWLIKLTNTSTPYVKWYEDPSQANRALLQINADAAATRVTVGNDIILSASEDGTETIFNENGNNIDFRIETDNVADAFFVDASEDRVEFGADHYIPTRNSSNPNVYFNEANQDMDFIVEGTTDADLIFADAGNNRVGIGKTPSSKLDVDGDVNVSAGSTYRINGTSIDAIFAPLTLASGWIAVSHTWTRTGNHTFTVSGDVTTTYRKGTKVRYSDGGPYEYGVVESSSYSSPNTTVTLITNSDYAMAAATITDTYISYIENPEGFPGYFNYTPTAGGAITLGNGTISGRFSVFGSVIEWDAAFIQGSSGGVGAGAATITNPTTLQTPLSTFYIGDGIAVDTATQRYRLEVEISTTNAIIYAQDASGAAVRLLNFSTTVPFTWVSGDAIIMRGRGYF